MKKTILLFFMTAFFFSPVLIFSQNIFNFQGVLRDAGGDLLANAEIDLRFRLITGMYAPGVDFEEIHDGVITNAQGVFVVSIGGLNPNALAVIDFSNTYEIEIAIRSAGENNFRTLDRSPLSAIPFAMHSLTTEDTDDADADPTNELQSLAFNASSNTLSISDGNEVKIPTGGTDADSDPENELQHLSLLGNGNIMLSQGGGEVPLNQSPLVSTTNTDGEFAYKLLQPLAIGKEQPTADASLDVAGPIMASLFRMSQVKILPAGSGFKGLRLENNEEVLAAFDASTGNEPTSLGVEQVKIGDVKIRNHLSDKDELWIRARSGSQDVQLMRLGQEISAINTDILFLSKQLQITHPSRSDGQTGFTLANSGANGNRWNMYVANGSGQLEFYHKGTLKARILASDGSYIKSSDARLKMAVTALPSVLHKVRQLRPSTYLFKDHPRAKNQSYGFIAQEVETLFPDLVYNLDEKGGDMLSLNYEGFAVIAIKAIQEQQEIIIQQKSEIQINSTRISQLEDQISRLENVIRNDHKN